VSQIKGKALTGYDKTRAPKKPAPQGRERFDEKKDDGLRAFVRELKCVVCVSVYGVQRSPTECAHVTSKGAAGGDFDNMVPLCAHHHQQQHRIGIRSFEYRYQVRLKAAARKVTAAYVAQKKHG
jgi:hypothetical protein